MDGVATQEKGKEALIKEETKAFFFETMAQYHVDIEGIERLDANNPAHRQAFYAVLDDFASQTPGAARYFDHIADKAAGFVHVPEDQNDSSYLNLREAIETELFAGISGIEKTIEMNETPIADYVAQFSDDATIANVMNAAPAPEITTADTPQRLSDEQLAEINANVTAAMQESAKASAAAAPKKGLPEFLKRPEDRTGIQMNPPAAQENDPQEPAPLTAKAPEGNPPALGPAIPSEAVPEGDAPAIGSAIIPEGDAPALGGVTAEDAIDPSRLTAVNAAQYEAEAPQTKTAAEPDIIDAEFEEEKEEKRTIWDMDYQERAALFHDTEERQDAFVKQAIADWYARYFGADDLTEDEIEILAINFTRDMDRLQVLNMIDKDVEESRQGTKRDLSEFDNTVIDRHIEMDPEAIERAVANKQDEKGLDGTNDSRLLSWVKPALGAAIIGGGASLAARGALNAVTGGVGGEVAGALGGAAGAYATERLKIYKREKELAQDPNFAHLPKRELRQEVIKQDKITTLQHRLAKLENDYNRAIEKAKETEQELRVATEELSKSDPVEREQFEQILKSAERAQTKMNAFYKSRNRVALKLETTRNKDASEFSLGKHLLSRVMMGAAMGTVAGGVMALEPVQQFMSDTFNAVSGFTANLLGLNGPDLATAGLGGEFVASLDPVLPDQQAAAPLDGLADNLAADIQAHLDGVAADAAAAAGPEIVPVSEAALAVVEQINAAGLTPMDLNDIGAALETHFEGDIPARFEPYITNLMSGDEALRAEGAMSIAHLLVENNAELAKEGHKALASSIMAASVMEFGTDSTNASVGRAIEGLQFYQPDLAEALQNAGATNLQDLSQLAQQAAAGDITLETHAEAERIAMNGVRVQPNSGPS